MVSKGRALWRGPGAEPLAFLPFQRPPWHGAWFDCAVCPRSDRERGENNSPGADLSDTSVTPQTVRGGFPEAAARPARPAAEVKPPRDYRLDFFRGLALFFIFIDHIPDNRFRYVTLRSFAFSDAAELFIFISGFTAAMVYGRAMKRDGFLLASARIYRRVWQLYTAHLCLFLIFSAEVSYTVLHFNNPLFADELKVGAFLDEPATTIMHVLTLGFQPSYLDILPLYIFLLGLFPLVLAALRVNLWLALGPSLAVYAAARLLGLAMPGYPEGRFWYFNPFAWQLLFVIAAAFGLATADGRKLLPDSKWLFRACLAFVIVGGVIEITWTLHEMTGTFPALLYRQLWPIDKSNLPLPRLFSMLAIAVVVGRTLPHNARFLTSRLGWLAVLCGQNSLEIFCLSILLSVLGNMAQTIYGTALPVQVVINFTGIAIMLSFGLLLAWFDGGGKLPVRPRPAGGPDPEAGA